MPLPGGPVERYSDRAAIAALGAAGAMYLATASPRRAAAVLLAGVPKAGRLGREAFASHLSRALCRRDLLVLDARALRRMDRIDTVVIDEPLLTTGRVAVGGLRLLEGADGPEVHSRLSRLFDPSEPAAVRKRGRWELGPVEGRERRRLDVRQAARELGGRWTLVLRASGRPVAVIAVEEELSAPALSIIRACRRQGHMVAVAGDDLELGRPHRRRPARLRRRGVEPAPSSRCRPTAAWSRCWPAAETAG